MAALVIKQESPDRLVLGNSATQKLSSIFNLIFLLIITYSLLSSLLGDLGGGDSPLSGLLILVFAFIVFRSLSGIVFSTTTVVDSSVRLASSATQFLGFPYRRIELPFNRIRRVLVSASVPVISQTAGRPVWQVALEPAEGAPLVLNSGGTHDEMVALATKVGALTSRPVSDELSRGTAPEAGAQSAPIQDFSGGASPASAPPVAAPTSSRRAPRPATRTPSAPIPAPNVLTSDSLSPEHSRFEEESSMPSHEAPSPGLPAAAPAMPSMPALGSGADSSPTSMPLMPPIGMSVDAGQSSMPTMPPLGMTMGPGEYQGAPVGGATSDLAGGGTLYSPAPIGMPDMPPLGTISSAPAPVSDVAPTPPPEIEAPRTGYTWKRAASLEELQRAMTEDPTNALPFFQMARLLHAQGDYRGALEYYTRASHLDPASAPIQNDLGVLYFQARRWKEAEASFRRAQGLDPFFVVSHYNLALLLTLTRRKAEAAQALTRGLQSSASDAERNLFSNAQAESFADPLLSPI